MAALADFKIYQRANSNYISHLSTPEAESSLGHIHTHFVFEEAIVNKIGKGEGQNDKTR